VVALFELHGVPAAAVRSPAEAVRDPRVLARGETVPIEHPQFGRVADVIGPGMPFRLTSVEPCVPRTAPATGQDNELVYGQWLGYDASSLEQLRSNRTI
jgi:crotonobetainyl-CoA:carnitine CoA-transferase CaiB-like acyl-CoA transferase